MVKPGYKQTEIGIFPEDWDIEKLINLSDGGMQNGTFYECSRKGTGVYFLNVGNLYETAPVSHPITFPYYHDKSCKIREESIDLTHKAYDIFQQ